MDDELAPVDFDLILVKLVDLLNELVDKHHSDSSKNNAGYKEYCCQRVIQTQQSIRVVNLP